MMQTHTRKNLPIVRMDMVEIYIDKQPMPKATYQRVAGQWQVEGKKKGEWTVVADPKWVEMLDDTAECKIKAGEAGTAIIPNAKPLVQTKEEIGFKKIAGEIIRDTIAVGEKWLTLCLYIREHNVTKENATTWLLDLGFHKSKASEVCKVSFCPPEMFSKYQTRMIGWRGILKAARTGDIEEMKKANVLESDPAIAKAVKEVAAEIEAHDKLLAKTVEEANKGKTPAQIEQEKNEAHTAALKERLARAAVTLLKTAAALGFKQKTFRDGDYTVTVARKGKPGPAGAAK